ncbi:hypothetical protein BTJ40_10230 [Microbulbifer sp. A4B17]|uniref:DUF2092 domain-containing protein n=1 Tax=Microbulbifer sp. A4B17 TaxID=359370 RepID=UPI000D52CCD7|nr:DUF2092 domain-containing protein [Microbulbifer sp. A4B17]AWF81164.1 hypothetical protein BTJ40_10230 [Microbulbifer sp. A4B17]
MLALHPFGGLARALILAAAMVISPAIVAQTPAPPPQPDNTDAQGQTPPPGQQPPPPASSDTPPPSGQMQQGQPPQGQVGTIQSDEPLDPRAMATLKRMGDYLASLKMLMFNADIFTEVVLENQEKLLIGGTVKYMAMPPKQLRVDLKTDSITRQFIHNGDKFTIIAPRDGYFAEMEASQPTAQVLTKAAKDYGIEIPFADLLEWGRKENVWSGIKEGFLVNRPMVDGHKTEHWAFRSENLDWEIWIKAGDTPLPLRISTVNTRDPAKPRFIATLKWMEAKPGAAGQFSPSTDKLKQIPFKKAEPNKEATP